ncbi:enoyl-CoA hydratase-related protein, partial [Myxococcota bacterium]|nr:enoyl-CoA hydratase-related protein [Myxococcota bacterium]
MTEDSVLLQKEETADGAIALVTLNRPEVRNAIDLRMVQDLGKVLDAITADDAIRAVVMYGAGDKAFASGADIAQLKERGVADALKRINSAVFRRVEELPVPVIAAIRGFCLGGGCELAMACDLRIAGASAKLGQPEVSLGILAGAGAVQRLPKLVGLGKAKELIFTGAVIDANEAERIGLVN